MKVKFFDLAFLYECGLQKRDAIANVKLHYNSGRTGKGDVSYGLLYVACLLE